VGFAFCKLQKTSVNRVRGVSQRQKSSTKLAQSGSVKVSRNPTPPRDSPGGRGGTSRETFSCRSWLMATIELTFRKGTGAATWTCDQSTLCNVRRQW
jgi:hypothetical protein